MNPWYIFISLQYQDKSWGKSLKLSKVQLTKTHYWGKTFKVRLNILKIKITPPPPLTHVSVIFPPSLLELFVIWTNSGVLFPILCLSANLNTGGTLDRTKSCNLKKWGKSFVWTFYGNIIKYMFYMFLYVYYQYKSEKSS